MATQKKFFSDLGLETSQNLSVDGNATISGDLTVNGTSTTINSSITSVEDNMLELANGNTLSDTIDIGFYGNYDDGLSDGGATEFTGLFRDASDSTWKLFDGLEVEPGSTVNITGTGYALADLTVGDLTATTLTATNGLTGSSITYPTSDGTNGQVIKTDGSGDLSFGNVSLDSLSDCTISASTPNSTTNPPYAGAMWIEEDTGDVYVCTNATTNNNTWVKTGSADGITTSGSNTIIQSPDDTNVIHVNNSAEVGIGTASPAAKLDVQGGAGSGTHTHAVFTGTTGRGLALKSGQTGGQHNGKAILDAQDTEAGGASMDFQIGGTTQWGINNSGHITPSQQHTKDIGGVNAEVRNIYAQGLYVGGSAAANQLDDYEEGSWTPALSGLTTNSSTMYGIYTKIGNICHIHAKIAATVASLPGATFVITGLPFTSLDASDSNQRAIITIGGDCVNLGGNAIGKAHFRTNGTNLQGVYLNSGTTAYWTYNTMDSTSFELNIHGFYTV